MKARTKRWLSRGLLPLGLLWLCFVGYIGWAMRQPPEVFGHVMSRMPMPAFFLFVRNDVDTRAERNAARGGYCTGPDCADARYSADASPVRALERQADRPRLRQLHLTTLPAGGSALNKLSEQYKGKVDFYAIYILEAHPTDVWQMQSNVRDKVLFRTPRDMAERVSVAGACVRRLKIQFPALVDGLEDRVEAAYTGWPDRMYLIDRGGRITFKSKAGPFGFHPEELAAALQKLTSTTSQH